MWYGYIGVSEHSENSAVKQYSDIVKSICSGARMSIFRNSDPPSNVTLGTMLNLCGTL